MTSSNQTTGEMEDGEDEEDEVDEEDVLSVSRYRCAFVVSLNHFRTMKDLVLLMVATPHSAAVVAVTYSC